MLVLPALAAISPPRHRRRHLLLPRGLVALGSLLLLGCRLLVDDPRLKRYSVLQLTMPMVCDNADKADEYRRNSCLPSKQELAKRLWQISSFSGQAHADSLNWLRTKRQLDALHQYPMTNGGVAVQFLTHARYANLVQTLSYINQVNIKRYFLHIHSPVTTLYVLPNKYSPSYSDSEDYQPATTEPAPTSALDNWLGQIGGHVAGLSWRCALLGGLLATLAWLLLAAPEWWNE